MKRFVVSMIISLCVLVGSVSAIGLPIIGKATIKKGTTLPIVVMVTPTQPVNGEVTAFEDQVVYINAKIDTKPGLHRGGYILDGEGFIHDCSTHGRERIGLSLIILPQSVVLSGVVKIELF